MSKIVNILLFIFLIVGCSYEPILLNKNLSFKFVNIITNGDKDFNKILKEKLTDKNDGDKGYNIFITTKRDKEILSSDTKGDPKIFKIKFDVEFKIEDGEKFIFNNKITEEFTYNNMNDKFELLKLEENIINTIAQKISNEISMSVVHKIK
ncbi:hypothetical protein OA168_03645 [Candidatus Pelagibacter sp.]|nr:hypothetical protein [Candidatus Pelagibacter sp.]